MTPQRDCVQRKKNNETCKSYSSVVLANYSQQRVIVLLKPLKAISLQVCVYFKTPEEHHRDPFCSKNK